jgi:hypothetical protein
VSGRVSYVESDSRAIPFDLLARPARPSRGPWLVLSPLLCPAALLEVPRAPEARMRELVRYRLCSLFPLRAEELAFGYARLPRPHGQWLLVFAMRSAAARDLLTADPDAHLVPAALLAWGALTRRRGTAKVDEPDATIRLKAVPGEDPVLTVTETDPENRRACGAPPPASALRIAARPARSLSGKVPPSFAVARTLLPLVVSAGACWHLADGLAATRSAELASLRRSVELRAAATREVETRRERIRALETALTVLAATRSPSAYGFLGEVASRAPPQTRLTEVAFDRAGFELRGTTADAWALARGLGSAPGIRSAELVETTPSEGGAARFVVRGSHGLP